MSRSKFGRYDWWLREGRVFVSGLLCSVLCVTGVAAGDGDVTVGGQDELQRKAETLERMIPVLEAQSDHLQNELDAARELARQEDVIRSGQAMREQLDSPDDPFMARSLNDVGLLMAAEGQLDDAQALFERALKMIETHYGLEHPARGTVLQNLGEVLWRKQDPRAAECYRDAAMVFGGTAGASHPRVAAVLNAWAACLVSQGRSEGAETLFRRAIRIYEGQKDPYPPDLVAPLYNLALLLVAQDRGDEAGTLLKRAHSILKHNRDMESAKAVLVLRAMAQHQRLVGNIDQASLYDNQAGLIVSKPLEQAGKRGK